jgi:hypothetical protein
MGVPERVFEKFWVNPQFFKHPLIPSGAIAPVSSDLSPALERL